MLKPRAIPNAQAAGQLNSEAHKARPNTLIGTSGAMVKPLKNSRVAARADPADNRVGRMQRYLKA